MIHISNLSHSRVNKVEDVLKIGQELDVKVIEIDPQGKVSLSHKATLPAPAGGEKSDSKSSGRPSDRNKKDFKKS